MQVSAAELVKFAQPACLVKSPIQEDHVLTVQPVAVRLAHQTFVTSVTLVQVPSRVACASSARRTSSPRAEDSVFHVHQVTSPMHCKQHVLNVTKVSSPRTVTHVTCVLLEHTPQTLVLRNVFLAALVQHPTPPEQLVLLAAQDHHLFAVAHVPSVCQDQQHVQAVCVNHVQ